MRTGLGALLRFRRLSTVSLLVVLRRPPWLSSVLLFCFLPTRSTGEIHGVVVSSNASNNTIPSAAFGVIAREAFGARGKPRDIRVRENGRERRNESSPQTILAHHQRRRARTPRSRS